MSVPPIWYLYNAHQQLSKYTEDAVTDTQPLFANKCTCGAAKASEPNPPPGHADWCDSLKPIPVEEELPF